MNLKILLRNRGIRLKVVYAAVVIAIMLFLSAGVAYVEFSRMSEYVSTFIAKNMECINSSNDLLKRCEKFNQSVLSEDETAVAGDSQLDSNLNEYICLLVNNGTIDSGNRYADSLRYAYSAYMQVVRSSEDMWFESYSDKVIWYRENVDKVYVRLRSYLSTLSSLSQNVLSSNYDELSDRYYRSIMPAVLSIGASTVLIFLFVYFLNIFILSPIIKMHAGLKDYKEFGRPYKVSFDKGGDQVQELNELIKEMTDTVSFLRKR